MLTITPTAETILTRARTEKGVPADYGVRFYATKMDDSDRSRLAFKFVPAPGADDTAIDETGLDAYVAPEVERLIGDVVIDGREKDGRMDLVVRRSPQED
jgi:Fe-S cluster assembly iron-binding protein IscA